MDPRIIFLIKLTLLTEAIAHALKNWGILDDIRLSLTARSVFLARLLSCFECVSVWAAAFSFLYIYFLDLWPITFIILSSRAAAVLHIVIDLLDAWRASTLNKV